MSSDQARRPIERRMLKLADAGLSDIEIAWRFRRTPRSVRQVIALSRFAGRGTELSTNETLRPIERRVLRWRDQGADFNEMASRFRRQPASLEQIETLARYKLAR